MLTAQFCAGRAGLTAASYGSAAGRVARVELLLAGTFADLAALRDANGEGAPAAVDTPMGLLETLTCSPHDADARALIGAGAATDSA